MLKNRTLLTFCISILVFILISLFRPQPASVTVLPLNYNPVYESNPISERFWVMKTQAATRFDMIVMGDSRVYRGISPETMQSVLKGKRILNYGFSGGGLNHEMYSAATLRLDQTSQRKAILLGVSPLTLCPRSESNEHYLQEINRPPDYVFLHLYWTSLVNLFEPVHLRSFNTSGSMENSMDKNGYYLEFHDDGWIASWTLPEYPDSQIESYQAIYSTTRVSPRLVQDLLDQTRAWAAQGINVYAYRPPTSQAMLDLENQFSGFNEVEFADQFKAAGGVWFSMPIAGYHSYDGSHLNKQSAEKLSLDLAELIRQSEGD